MIRVAVADDQQLIRMALTTLLAAQPDVEIVAEAADGSETVELVRLLRPDVLLLDIRMPVMDGLEVLRVLAADGMLGATRVVVLTTFEIDQYVFDALRLGARGFLTKDSDADELVRAVRVTAAGQSLLSPGVTRRLVESFAAGTAPTPHPAMSSLTTREREVVTLVARGLSNDDIATTLVVSPATVRTHVGRAMTKLDAHDRAQLVVFALHSGLG